MIEVPLLNIRQSWHIGTLDPSDRAKHHKHSLEGHGLSVSLCPEAWRQIVRLGGSPLWQCDNDSACFVDVLGIPEASMDEIVQWARDEGLVRDRKMWKAWIWDDEDEAWSYMLCKSQKEAVDQLDEIPLDMSDLDPFLKSLEGDMPPLPGGASSLVEEVTVPELTIDGNERSRGRVGYGVDATDMAVMFWVEDVLRREVPDVVGVWWKEHYAPEAHSAPRGAILPSCMDDFSFTWRDWSRVPDDEPLLETMPDATMVTIAAPSPAPQAPR